LARIVRQGLVGDLPERAIGVHDHRPIEPRIVDHAEQPRNRLHALRSREHAAVRKAAAASINPDGRRRVVVECVNQVLNGLVGADVRDRVNRLVADHVVLGNMHQRAELDVDSLGSTPRLASSPPSGLRVRVDLLKSTSIRAGVSTTFSMTR
jgi:hypothetical protein